MVSKPQTEEFTQEWNRTVNWAKQNKIPFSAYYPIYQQDASRLMSGSAMSESERIRAIEAAAGLNDSTALPTPTNPISSFFSDISSNVSDIVTGLEPTHLVENALDTVKNTIEHPSTLYGPLGDALTGNEGAAARKILGTNSILNYLPGVNDLAKVFAADPHLTGSAGATALAKDPVSSVLDILPFGRAASEGLGRLGVGDTVAAKIDLSNEEMRKLGIWRVGGRAIKSLEVPNNLTRSVHPWLFNEGVDATTGLARSSVKGGVDPGTAGGLTQPTVNDFWQMFREKIGAGAVDAGIVERRLIVNQEGSLRVARIVSPALKILNDLNDSEREQLLEWTKSDFRPLGDKMHDASIPIRVRTAYEAAWKWGQTLRQLHLQAGDAVRVRAPWNDVDADGDPIFNPDKPPKYETYYVDSENYPIVKAAEENAQKTLKAFQSASGPLKSAMFKMDETDRNLHGVIDALRQSSQALYQQMRGAVDQADSTAVEQTDDATIWDQAVEQNPTYIRNILGLLPSDKLTKSMITQTRNLLAPGGLVDEIAKAYDNEDWKTVRELSAKAVEIFNNKAFSKIPQTGRATMNKIKHMLTNLDKYARSRDRTVRAANKAASETELAHLSVEAVKAQDHWVRVAIDHPPDVWADAQVARVSREVAQKMRTAANIKEAGKKLSLTGWNDSALTKVMSDPETMMQLMAASNHASFENAMLPDVDHEEAQATIDDANRYFASLRARGYEPLMVPTVSVQDLKNLGATNDVYVRGLRPRKAAKAFIRPKNWEHGYEKEWGYVPSIYDISAGLLKGTKDLVEHDMLQQFIDQELMPQLHDATTIQDYARYYFQNEAAATVDHPDVAPQVALEAALHKWNLESFDPKNLFGEGFSHPSLTSADGRPIPYYINSRLAKSFKQTVDTFQFPAQGIVDRGTSLFRFSILGLSPRYTAHILLGGTFLVGLRAYPSMLRYLGDAVYYARHGSFSEKTYQKFPDHYRPQLDKAGEEIKGGGSTAEGEVFAKHHYNRVMMHHTVNNWLVPEWLSRHKLNDEYQNRLWAMANINMTFTRAVVDAQKSVVYLDGAARALKEGNTFYEEKDIPRTPESKGSKVDAQGRPVYHPVTQRVIHDKVRSKVPMSPEQAHYLGMEAVSSVMGNLRHMTPLERNVLSRIFPFYGWTKHVLRYVMSYPFDHPWRAMILSNMAMQNVEDQASGLPIRTQLLTFLGQPDTYGNVTAIDTKSLDPLRDTANYLSLTGIFESLNPAVTGPIGLVDPQIQFGGQNPYPQVTYNQLYGVKTAGPGGNLVTAAEQFVPQLTALDEAFNLSGQYAYLSQAAPGTFIHKLTESLGLPLMPETINLRQIAAQGEIDRYQQAENAAYNAASTGDLSSLAGYAANAQLPDPLNTEYNVTPEYIAAMTQQSEEKYGMPWYATGTPPPTPRL